MGSKIYTNGVIVLLLLLLWLFNAKIAKLSFIISRRAGNVPDLRLFSGAEKQNSVVVRHLYSYHKQQIVEIASAD